MLTFIDDKTHIFYNQNKRLSKSSNVMFKGTHFVNNVRKLGSGQPFIYKNIIVKFEGIEKWSKYLLSFIEKLKLKLVYNIIIENLVNITHYFQ